MGQRDLLKRYLDAGISFTSMTKSRAEEIVKELVRAGGIQRGQFQNQVDEFIERSRRNSDHLVALVRREVASQLADLASSLRDEPAATKKPAQTGTLGDSAATTGPPAEAADSGSDAS